MVNMKGDPCMGHQHGESDPYATTQMGIQVEKQLAVNPIFLQHLLPVQVASPLWRPLEHCIDHVKIIGSVLPF